MYYVPTIFLFILNILKYRKRNIDKSWTVKYLTEITRYCNKITYLIDLFMSNFISSFINFTNTFRYYKNFVDLKNSE